MHVLGVIGGGEIEQVRRPDPAHGRGCPEQPVVDLYGQNGRRRADGLDQPGGRGFGGNDLRRAPLQQGAELVLGGDQRRAATCSSRLLKDRGRQDEIGRLHVDGLAPCPIQIVVGRDAVQSWRTAGDDRNVVDVGHGRHGALAHGRHGALAHGTPATAAKLVQRRHGSVSQIIGTYAIEADDEVGEH
jgi:hypothetical protein